ncbi:MAG: hypothetical protein GX774_10905, partial [Armatimonadetes bacterium]|nr:hypothetical protein [Armatimonadota bacterium]
MGLTLVGTSSVSGSLPATYPHGAHDETSIALPSGVQAGDLVFVVCCGNEVSSPYHYATLKADSRYVFGNFFLDQGRTAWVPYGVMQLGEDLSDIVVRLPRLGGDTKYEVNTATWRCLLAAYRPSVELPALALTSYVGGVPSRGACGLSLLRSATVAEFIPGGQHTLTLDLGVDFWTPTAWERMLGLVYIVCH